MGQCPTFKDGSISRGDALDLLGCLPDGSANLIVTSPPYANARKRFYDSIDPDRYDAWFAPIAKEMHRVVSPDGSLVLNIKDISVNGKKHPYVFKTVLAMQDAGWRLNDTFIWHKPNPFPREPVNKLKDGFEYLFHFVKSPKFTFHPERVMVDATPGSCKKVESQLKKNESYTADNDKFYRRDWNRFGKNCKRSYPSNVLTVPVGSNKRYHPAQFPEAIPDFFVNLMSNPGDTVVDPFAGSGTTIVAAMKNCRKGIGFDVNENYVTLANNRLKNNGACES